MITFITKIAEANLIKGKSLTIIDLHNTTNYFVALYLRLLTSFSCSLIVCEDADFEFAVEAAIRGSFLNCGQNCIAAERIYVHKSVYDK